GLLADLPVGVRLAPVPACGRRHRSPQVSRLPLSRPYGTGTPGMAGDQKVDRAAGTDRSGGYAIGAGSAEPGQSRTPTPGLANPAWALLCGVGGCTARER